MEGTGLKVCDTQKALMKEVVSKDPSFGLSWFLPRPLKCCQRRKLDLLILNQGPISEVPLNLNNARKTMALEDNKIGGKI